MGILGFLLAASGRHRRRRKRYLLCCGLVSALIWAVVKARLSAVRAHNRKLEKFIQERTEEICAQRDRLQAQHDELKAQEEKAVKLLLNILPASIAEELRTSGAVQPLTCENITVCFTDFVGFTLSSEQMAACDLVAALDEYFSEFDRIVDRYGLEKLKTIGDSYMFAGGLPKPKASHAIDAVRAALEIVEMVKGRAASPPGWQIRVGLHSGPAIAGVVGQRKFAFDIWGETVNFASRHESCGLPNCVNISAQTYELVQDFVDCEPRGPVRIKEGRCLEMYLARRIRHL
jgi:adenylate cyclase